MRVPAGPVPSGLLASAHSAQTPLHGRILVAEDAPVARRSVARAQEQDGKAPAKLIHYPRSD
jgi:hypothetical protein